jgi:hypothetical protein
MSTITGFGISPFSYRSQATAAGQDAVQVLGTTSTANAVGSSASLASSLRIVQTGLIPAPRLSANVIDALLQDRAQQSAQGATSAGAATNAGAAASTGAAVDATTLSGASAQSTQAAASSDSSSSDSSSSKPPTLQDIAKQFDLHNLTNTQFESVARQLSAAGAISDTALLEIATRLGGLGVSPALEGKPSSGPSKIVGIWDGVKDDTPPYDVVSKVKGWLTADTQAGFPQVQTDQHILNVLNQLDSLRNGASTSAA